MDFVSIHCFCFNIFAKRGHSHPPHIFAILNFVHFPLDSQKMNQENAADELETSYDELSRLELLAKLPLPADASHCEELRHLDELLAGFKDLNDLYRRKNERMQRVWQQKMDKKEALMNQLQREKDNMYNILISSKANYFQELVEAERKIKSLENECSNMKVFITRDLLMANENVSALIRNRYGDDKANVLAAPKTNFCPATLTTAAEHTSTPAAIAENEPLLAILPVENEAENGAENESEQPSTSIDPHPSTSQQPPTSPQPSTSEKQLAGDVIEITDDEHWAEQNDEQMETDESNMLNRFPCEYCSYSFNTMAKKYRHETRVHDAHETEQQNEKVEQMKKPLKRLNRLRRLAKEKKIRDAILMRRLLFKSFIETNSTPVKRTKKTVGK